MSQLRFVLIALTIIFVVNSALQTEPGEVSNIQDTNYKVANLSLPEVDNTTPVPKLPKPQEKPQKIANPKVTLLNSSNDYSAIYNFVLNSYPGSRIDKSYLDLLARECKDTHTLKLVISASLSESGMGKHLPHRQSNFWGWFLGGNKNHDPDRATMAKQICAGFRNRYQNIYNGTQFDYSLVKLYTGNDRPSTWSKNFAWAYNKM